MTEYIQTFKAAKTSLKASVTTKTMALAGRVVRKTPDVDVDTGKVANRLSDLSKPARHRTTRQLTELKDETWRVIERNDYEGQAVKVLRTGKKGRKALDALGTAGKRNLLKLADDLATERAIVNAWERGDISTEEMATALRRFDELDAAERQAYKDLARQTGADAVEVLAKSDGPARRAAADGGIDEGFRKGIARAADSDAIDSFDQIDDVVRKIEDLDGPANRRAKLLVYDTDGAGVKLVDGLDDETLQTVLEVDIDRARDLRAAFARHYRHGYASVDDIEEFARHVDNLEGVDGLNSGPVDDFIRAKDPGNIDGAFDEVRRADEIGAENIRRMNVELPNSNKFDGELDIQLESGKIIESKGSFGYRKTEIDRQFRNKLRTMREHEDVEFDGNTIVIRANRVGDEDLVETKIREWESKVASNAEWNNADIDIVVIEEETGTIIDG